MHYGCGQHGRKKGNLKRCGDRDGFGGVVGSRGIRIVHRDQGAMVEAMRWLWRQTVICHAVKAPLASYL